MASHYLFVKANTTMVSDASTKMFIHKGYMYSPYIRDSRFSRLGTETPRLSVQVSSRNRTRNRLQAKRGLGISLGTETMKLQVSVSEPESGYSASCMKTPKKYFFTVKNCLFSRNRNRNAETLGSHPGIGIGLGIDV